MVKDYQIPDSAYKFYGTGIFGNIGPGLEQLNSFLVPILKYYQPKVTPAHISCRYLGYCDEVDNAQIEALIPALKEIYKKYLPVECVTIGLYGSWQAKPEAGKHLLMAEVQSEKLAELHSELMAATQEFQNFGAVQGANFRAHVSIGHLKEEFAQVPEELKEYVRTTVLPPFTLKFTKAYIYTVNGYQEI